MMIHIERWSRSSDDVLCWSRSRDDPDPVMIFMLIQIERWSRSSDDVLWWSRSRDDPDPAVMIQIERWSRSSPVMMIQIERWSRSEDEDDLKTKMTWRQRWSSWSREEDQCWKLCRNNTFLVKRECWCICNFRMYPYMYLMYFNQCY